MHSFVCLGFSPLVLGSCRSAPILSAVDAVHLGLSSFSQGRAQARMSILSKNATSSNALVTSSDARSP